MTNIKCTYFSSSSQWLRLGQMKLQVNSVDPFQAIIKNLLFSHECDEIISNFENEIGEWKGTKKRAGKHQLLTDVRMMRK